MKVNKLFHFLRDMFEKSKCIFFFDRKDENNRLTLVIDFKKEKQD